MKKVLLAAGVCLALLAIAAAGAFAGLVWIGDRKLERPLEVRVVPVPFVKDTASLRQGKYLFESRGCAECHGFDGRGIAFIDEPGGTYARSPNITSGPGSAVRGYSEGDWVRAIRHGVSPQGRVLQLMPSVDYNRLNDPDFAALVAYVRGLPPVAAEPAAVRLPLLARALHGAGLVKNSAERIDHRAPPSPVLRPAATVEHGAYVATMCIGCHGPAFKGGIAMARYDTPDKFVAMMRSGKRPDGSAVSEAMPFTSLRNLNDTDLQAMYAYLRTLPASPAVR